MPHAQPAPERSSARLEALPEAELVRRAQLGSAAAFERLVELRGPGVHRYLSLELRQGPDVHDALQETLAAAWRGLPGLRDAERFWPWLVGIAANKATDALRRRSRQDAHAMPVEPEAPDGSPLVELRDGLASLPGPFREVLLLRYVVGLSEEEAAAALGVRVGTVKSRTARARRALMERLA